MKDKQRFLKRAGKIALESGCLRGKRGAVFVKKGQILVEAYNIVFPENDYCKKKGCLRDKLNLGLGKDLEKCRSVHAEARAICLAARDGIDINGSIAYITCMPCMNCAKFMVSAGVREVYYLDKYGDKTSVTFLNRMGVKCERVKLTGDDFGQRLRDTGGQ